MKLVLLIISISMVIAVLAWFGTLVWKSKSKNSLRSLIANLICAGVIFLLAILQLIFEVILDEEYGITIFCLIAWMINTIGLSFNLRNVLRKIEKEKREVPDFIEAEYTVIEDEEKSENYLLKEID